MLPSFQFALDDLVDQLVRVPSGGGRSESLTARR
jgi:hypothetical protein